jgi:hypothetical protein
MKPLNLSSLTAIDRLFVSRLRGVGAMRMKVSSISFTPKLLMAEPKNTGAVSPLR